MNPAPRLVFAPLENVARGDRPRHLGRRCPCIAAGGSSLAGYCYCDADLARDLGVSTRRIYDWRTRGVPAWRADELACRLDSHPELIWPIQWPAWADAQPDPDPNREPAHAVQGATT